MSDLELITRLNNSGLGFEKLSEIIGVSPMQMRLILNFVSVMNPKLKRSILNNEQLKELW